MKTKKIIICILLVLCFIGIAPIETFAIAKDELVEVRPNYYEQTYTAPDDTTHTITWAKGVQGPIMPSDEKNLGKKGYFEVERIGTYTTYQSAYEENKGYYDLNKNKTRPNENNMCYMGAATNIIHWWMDQNSKHVDRYIEKVLKGEIKQEEGLVPLTQENFDIMRTKPTRGEMENAGLVSELGKDLLATKLLPSYFSRIDGYYMYLVWDHFFNGYPVQDELNQGIHNPEEFRKDKKGGFFHPLFGTSLITEAYFNSRYDFFRDNIKNWLSNDYGVTVSYYAYGKAHALTVWGADYDSKGELTRLYLTDTDDYDTPVINSNIQESRGIFGYNVNVENGLMYLGNDSQNKGVQMQSAMVLKLLSDEEWDILLGDPTVPEKPTISKQPEGRTYALNAPSETLEVIATKTSPRSYLTYQWFMANDETSKGTKIAEATTNKYKPTIGSVVKTLYYYCEITNHKNGFNTVATTNRVKIDTKDVPLVNAEAPKIKGFDASLVTYEQGQKAKTLTINATGNGELSYQWFTSPQTSTEVTYPIKGANSKSFTPPTNTIGRVFYGCEVTNKVKEATGIRTASAKTLAKGIKVIPSTEENKPLDIINLPAQFRYNDEFIPNITGGNGTGSLDFTVSGNAIKTSDGKVKITGVGEFSITAIKNNDSSHNKQTKEFKFTSSKALNEITELTFIDSTPKAKALFGDIEFKYYKKGILDIEITKPSTPGDYILRAVVKETTNYKGASKDLEFNIPKYVIDKATLLETDFTYNGLEIKPKVEVSYKGKILDPLKDYTIDYGTDVISGGTKTLKVSGIGDYTGEFTLEYIVKQADNKITKLTYENNEVVVESIFGTPTLKYYTWVGEEKEISKPTTPGNYYVVATIEETLSYKGDQKKYFFVIAGIEITNAVINEKDFVYNGSEIKPTVKVTYKDLTLTKGQDYELTYSNDLINAGSKQIIVNGKGDYNGTITLTYNVEKALNEITELTYTNNTPTAKAKSGIPTFKYFNKGDLKTPIDKPIKPGTYIVRAEVAENQNYKYCFKDLEFVVERKNITSVELTNPKQYYTGSEIKPTVKVMSGEDVLNINTDYTVEYLGNLIDAGNKQIKVTGVNDYDGIITFEYIVNKAENEITSLEYINKEPKATSKFGEIQFQFYQRGYLDNEIENPTKPGDYILRATVKETDNYKGATKDYNFIIENFIPIMKPIESVEIVFKNGDNGYIYTGNEIIPEYYLVFDRIQLKEDEYEVEYLNNVNVGTAQIVVKGLGDYYGSKTFEFKIIKKQVQITIEFTNNEIVTEAGGANIEYEYFKDIFGKKPLAEKPTKPGTYYVRAKINDANYEDAMSRIIEFKIIDPDPNRNNTSILIVSLSFVIVVSGFITAFVIYFKKDRRRRR